MKVIGKWIEIKPLPTFSTTLYVPDTVKDMVVYGEVLSVGDKCEDVEVGDSVFFSKFALVDGRIVRENEVSLIIQKQK